MISPRLKLLTVWLTLLVLACAVYAAGLSGYWVFDDFHNIVQNPSLQLRGWDKAHLIALLNSSDAGVLHRPLSVLSFYLDVYWFGMSPYAFKLTNILIHLIAGLSFAGMAHSLLQLHRDRSAPDLDPGRIHGIVLATTAVWLVHPINLTGVLYVVQRETSLSAVFTALAIWAYLWARRRQHKGQSAAWILWILTPALMAVGMACKENAALVPVFLFVIELTILDFRSRKGGGRDRQLLAFFAVFLVLPAAMTMALVLRGSPALVGGYAIRDFSMGERLLTECRVLFSYLRWIVAPDLKQLGLYHDDFPVSRGLLQPWTTLPAVSGIVVLAAGAFVLRRRLPWLSFGILWFFAGHLMESSLLPLELVFEHRNYVPLYGLVLGVTASVGGIEMTETRRKAVILVATLVVLLCAGLTSLRASEWRSPLAFAVYEVGHHPDSARAQYEVGAIYTALAMNGEPELAERAEAAMLRSRALDPNSISEDISLAITYTQLKQPDKVHAYLADAADRGAHRLPNAETQAALQTAATFSDDTPHLPFKDMDLVFQGVLSNPHLAANPCYAGNVSNTYALFLQDNDYVPEAMSRMHSALTLCPDLIYSRINYARLLIIYHDIPDALEQMKIIEAANTMGQYSLYVERLKTLIAEAEKRQ